MATGKYGIKINPYYGTNYNVGFSSADPWYNVGALLGTIWSNNYNKRGVQRGVDEAKQILDDMSRRQYGETIGDDSGYTTGVGTTNIGTNSVGGLYQNTDQANAVGTGTGFTSGPLGSAVQPQRQGQQPPPQQDPTLTVGGQQIQPQNFIQAPLSTATTKYADVNESMGVPKSNIPNMNSDIAYASANQQMGLPEATTLTETIPRDLSAEKLDYIANKYSISDNPDGDRAIVGMTANTVKNNIAQANAGDVPIIDPKQYQAAIRAELIKNGRTPYQIDQIMEMISPDIDRKVKEAKDARYQGLLGNYLEAAKAGDYLSAQIIGSQMAKYDPDAAKVAMAGLPTMRDEYNLRNNYDKMAKAFDYKKQGMYLAADISRGNARYNHDLAFNDFVRKNDYQIRTYAAAYGVPYSEAAKFVFQKGKNGNGSTNNDGTNSQINAAKEVLQREENFAKNNPGAPNPYKASATVARRFLTNVLTGGQGLSTVPQNPNNYDSVQDWLTQFRDAAGGRFSDKQLAQIARTEFKKAFGESGSGYLEQALKERGWI